MNCLVDADQNLVFGLADARNATLVDPMTLVVVFGTLERHLLSTSIIYVLEILVSIASRFLKVSIL